MIRPSQFADFQANAALALAKKARPAAARGRRRGSWTPLDVDGHLPRRRGHRARLHQPHAATTTGSPAQVADVAGRPPARRRAGRRPRRPSSSTTPRPNVAKEMHVGHLRTTIIGDALARVLELLGAPRDPAEPHRRLGHAVRHADRAPARRRRGLRRRRSCSVGDLERLLPGGAGASSTPTRTFADRARRRVVAAAGRRPGDAAALAASSSTRPSATSTPSTRTLGVTLTDDDLAGREHLQRRMLAGDLRRAGAARARRGQRRRAVRRSRRASPAARASRCR